MIYMILRYLEPSMIYYSETFGTFYDLYDIETFGTFYDLL